MPANDHSKLQQAHELLSGFLASVTAGQMQVTDAALSHLQIAACALQPPSPPHLVDLPLLGDRFSAELDPFDPGQSPWL